MAADDEQAKRDAAAQRIQQSWRAQNNRMRGQVLGTNERWNDAAAHAKLKIARAAADSGDFNDPSSRWKRGALFASQLQDGNQVLKNRGKAKEGSTLKHLETQHWLELVDGKHRYGSNLKFYHRRWQTEDTTENFFRWLDKGGGKDLSLDECPREQLEKETIMYLSAEQRLNYLIEVDDEGKLHWARNRELVDTTAGHWKDSPDGGGIIPEDQPNKNKSEPNQGRQSFDSISSASSSSIGGAATHYAGDGSQSKNRWTAYFRKYLTVSGIANRLLRKTVKRNTWIYVTDRNFNIFIGIKDTGAFQHSSFLSGGLVTSAGLISVKQGVVHTLSPLSGHYRTKIDHFHQFISALEERGVDMHKAKISKAEAALWGIEHINKFKTKEAAILKSGKETVKSAGHMIVSPSDWKKDVLEGRRQQRIDEEEDNGEEGNEDFKQAKRGGFKEFTRTPSEKREDAIKLSQGTIAGSPAKVVLKNNKPQENQHDTTAEEKEPEGSEPNLTEQLDNQANAGDGNTTKPTTNGDPAI